MEATLREQIMSVDRAFPFYYRVGFYGTTLPPDYQVRCVHVRVCLILCFVVCYFVYLFETSLPWL